MSHILHMVTKKVTICAGYRRDLLQSKSGFIVKMSLYFVELILCLEDET